MAPREEGDRSGKGPTVPLLLLPRGVDGDVPGDHERHPDEAGEAQVHRRGQEAALQVLRGREKDDRHQRDQSGGKEDSEGKYDSIDNVDDNDDDNDNENDDYDDVDDDDYDDEVDDYDDGDDNDEDDDDVISVERGGHFVLAEKNSGCLLRGLPGASLPPEVPVSASHHGGRQVQRGGDLQEDVQPLGRLRQQGRREERRDLEGGQYR